MTLEIIIYRIIIVILIIIIYMAVRKIKWQDTDIMRLLKEAAETLTDLRLKEDEVDRLKEIIKDYQDLG